jgi:feruloyl esterase
VEDFYRLFMIPGMGHCGGGIGPNGFDGATAVGAKLDPERDLAAALDQWVEKGIAPDHFIGTGKSISDPGKVLTRPICLYPKVARYKGSGDINDAANFVCAVKQP